MWPNQQRPLILIVDDEPMNLSVLGSTLSERYELAVATNGAEALNYLSEGRMPNLILLDVLMPGMDGFEVCQALKANPDWRHLPVVFLTAATTVESEQRGFEVGAVDYIHKPFDRRLVVARVKSHLTVHGMMDRLDDTATTMKTSFPKSPPGDLQLEDTPILSTIFEHATEGIMVFSRGGRVICVNPSFERITGLHRDAVVGQTREALHRKLRRSEFSDYLWRQVCHVGRWRGELINRRNNGDTYPELRTFNLVTDHNGDISHVVSVFSDISVTKQNQEKIDYLTWYDGLTSLPNRLLLMDRLQMSLRLCLESNSHNAIAVFDLDRFKEINQSLGLQTGDQVLVEIGQRLKAFCRETETVARLDSDEFAFLMSPSPGSAENSGHKALERVRKLQAWLSAPYELNEQTVHLNVSFGVCMIPVDRDTSAENALKMAETAHHRAKEHPTESILSFQEEMAQESRDLFRIAQGLRKAIHSDELEIHLQSQMSINGDLRGAEALARWTDPNHGPVSPGRFIPVAEDSDLIVHLDRRVLGQVLDVIRDHPRSLAGLRMAVNISGRHFAREDFVEHVTQALERAGLSGSCLTIELTESIMIQQLEEVVAKMQALAQLGIRFSIDDFGTGYSSLSYLRHLPIQELKIDRSFTSEIETSQGGQSIVKLVHRMAHELGLETVVEGVESQAQVDFLRQWGDVTLQGFLVARPQPARDWLGQHHRRQA